MRIAAMMVLLAAPLPAQDIKFPASLDKLAEKASEVVDVTLDANMLQMASRFLSGRDADQARIRKVVGGLKGIYVRSFQFEKTGEYRESDVDAIRSQLRSPTWSKIASVRSRKKGDSAEVFIKSEGGRITGLTVLAAEPTELTIVNIVGPIDPEDLAELGGSFGIPQLGGVAAPRPKTSTGGKKEE